MATAKKAAPKKKSAAKKSSVKVAAANNTQSRSAGLFAKKYDGNEGVLTFFKDTSFVGALIAEIVGVFLLTVVVLATQASPLYVMFGVLGISLAVYAFSGAHINPLITVGAWATRRISSVRAVFYLIAQVLGALLGYVVLSAFLKGAPEVSAEAAQYGQTAPELWKLVAMVEGKEWFLVLSEFVGASVIGLFFARALKYKKSVFTFGATAATGVFIALLLVMTTTSYLYSGQPGGFALNPALAVALQAFGGDAHLGWALLTYAAAPLVGGVLGFLVNDLITATGVDQD
jgi:glycerol uptake facilitator-like aquaporin